MGISLLLAACLGPLHMYKTPVNGNDVWEEPPAEQKIKQKMGEYTPYLRFKPEMTYIFGTPDFIQEGKYTVQDNHYVFRAIMAFEIENSDVAKLREDMSPKPSLEFGKAYARSMSNFEADYNGSTGILTLSYPVKGQLHSYQTYPYTDGDGNLSSAVYDDERGVPGLWHSPEPFPEKIDARTRYKIGGLEGLQKFFSEAMASDGAQFGLLDLRIDKSYRCGSEIGTWSKNGSVITLRGDGKPIELTISSNGQKLLSGGKALYVRD